MAVTRKIDTLLNKDVYNCNMSNLIRVSDDVLKEINKREWNSKSKGQALDKYISDLKTKRLNTVTINLDTIQVSKLAQQIADKITIREVTGKSTTGV